MTPGINSEEWFNPILVVLHETRGGGMKNFSAILPRIFRKVARMIKWIVPCSPAVPGLWNQVNPISETQLLFFPVWLFFLTPDSTSISVAGYSAAALLAILFCIPFALRVLTYKEIGGWSSWSQAFYHAHLELFLGNGCLGMAELYRKFCATRCEISR